MPENKLYFTLLDDISDKDLKAYVSTVIENYHTMDNHIEFQKQMTTAEKALDILFTILEEKGIFNRTIKPYKSWIEILISAVYLYYAAKNRNKPESFIELFEIRQNTWQIAQRNHLSMQTFDVLCQTVEAGYGSNGVPACKPTPGTPSELMALSIFIVERILPSLDKTITDAK